MRLTKTLSPCMFTWHQSRGILTRILKVNVRMPLRRSGDCGILAPHFTPAQNSLIS